MFIPNRYIYVVGAALFALLILAALLQTPYRRYVRRLFLILGIIGGIILLSAGGWVAWTRTRPQPPPLQQQLFEGVEYIREVRQTPVAQVIHIIRINTKAAGLRFFVSPGVVSDANPPREVQAQNTSTFLSTNKLQIAINGDFFHPFFSRTPFDYYPRTGDWVNILGFAASNGDVYSDGALQRYGAIFFSEDNRAAFDWPDGTVYNAISGDRYCLREGKVATEEFTDDYHHEPHPRTVIALSEDRQTVLLIVVDGRQPNYSEGASLEDTAQIALKYGGWTALNLDGGGSTTLVVADEAGQPRFLNTPIDNYIPGRERAVGNHLGVFAAPLAK